MGNKLPSTAPEIKEYFESMVGKMHTEMKVAKNNITVPDLSAAGVTSASESATNNIGVKPSTEIIR
jgi:hypothetical protein